MELRIFRGGFIKDGMILTFLFQVNTIMSVGKRNLLFDVPYFLRGLIKMSRVSTKFNSTCSYSLEFYNGKEMFNMQKRYKGC